MTRSGYWVDLTAEEFRALDQRTIAILPLGASEQHGPHLPLATDRDLVDAVVRRGLALLDDTAPPALALPTLAVTKSNEHRAFPGTLTLSAETLLRVIVEIGDGVARAGVRRMLLFNGHGGNVAIMDVAARELRARYGLTTCAASWYQLCGAERELSPRELAHGIHAGQMETSAMLAERPALVHMERARDFRSATETWAEQFALIGLGARPARPGWLMEDLSPEGACGDASAGTAEQGQRMLDTAAAGLVALLRELGQLSHGQPSP